MAEAPVLTRSAPVAGPSETVAFLRRAETYGDVGDVRAVETHMSWVFLVGSRAYKLKKPVRYRHVDFSTLDRRRRACHEEIRLNRRLAPDVYLGVTPILRGDRGDLSLGPLGGEGGATDYLVTMRRLADERMLDRRIAAGDLRPEEVDAIGAVLARFYREQPALPCTAEAYLQRLAATLRDDRDALVRPAYGLPVGLVERVAGEQLEFIEQNAATLGARATEGHIVDGHGDLRPEHVCVEPRPVVIDCLEFDATLRRVDAASDMAFLALECQRLGAAEVGEALLARYAVDTGDRPSPRVLDFYRARNAFMRAKVAAWHCDDDGIHDRARWRDKALRYLALASDVL